MDRRAYLTAVGVGLAGCAAPLGAGGNGSDGGEVLYTGTDSPTIQPGNFVPYRFSLAETATLSYSITVVDGPAVDVIVTSAAHAEAFANGERWQFYDPASASAVTETSVTAALDPGEWVLIVDNSPEGEANPWTPTATPTGTPPEYVPSDATPTPTPERLPVTISLEYAVTAGSWTPPGTNGTTQA